MEDHVCHSARVLKGDKLSSLSRGHVWWWVLAEDAGPCAALPLRQKRIQPAGSALKCPQLGHHRKQGEGVLICGAGGLQ